MDEAPDYQDVGGEKEIRQRASQARQLFLDILETTCKDEVTIDRIPTLFQQHPEEQLVLTLSDLRDEFEQFRMWARNIGVFASDNASLDYRLREALDVKHGVVTLLQSLVSHLRDVTFLLQQDRSYEVESRPGTDGAEDESDSDSESEDLTDSEASCVEMQSHLRQTSDIITKLMHLARVIRVTGARSRASKAATYEHWEDGVNVTKTFEQDYLPKVLQVRFQLQESLLERFCKVISQRRRQFMYQRRHQKRLAYDDQSHSLVKNSNFPVSEISGTLEHARRISPNTIQNMVGRPCGQAGDTRSAITAQTRATTMQPSRLKRSAPAPSTLVASTAKLALSKAEIPPAPNVPEGVTHFECPYCCLLVERHKSATAAWRKHVVNDLQPFVCIEPTCADPYIILESWTEWVEHHKWAHAMEWWCEGIDADHRPLRFTTAETYAEHLMTEHMASLSVRDRASAAGGPSREPFSCCPFCSPEQQQQFVTGGDIADMQEQLARTRYCQTRLQSHIFDHLLSMFLLSLPVSENGDETDDGDLLEEASSAAAGERTQDSLSTSTGEHSWNASLSSHDTELWCYCRKQSYGNMVACENEDCKYQWFHVDCLNLKKMPPEDEDWYCPDCSVRQEIIDRVRLAEAQKRRRATSFFTCPHIRCLYHDTGFPNKEDLNRHLLQQHSSSVQEYQCVSCTFKTSREPDCILHMKTQHAEQWASAAGGRPIPIQRPRDTARNNLEAPTDLWPQAHHQHQHSVSWSDQLGYQYSPPQHMPPTYMPSLPPPAPPAQMPHLQPGQSAPWTADEDAILVNAKSQGLGWNEIHQRHFPLKSGNACRKRHERLMQKLRTTDRDDGHVGQGINADKHTSIREQSAAKAEGASQTLGLLEAQGKDARHAVFGDDYSRSLHQTYGPTADNFGSLSKQQQMKLMQSLEQTQLSDVSNVLSDTTKYYTARFPQQPQSLGSQPTITTMPVAHPLQDLPNLVRIENNIPDEKGSIKNKSPPRQHGYGSTGAPKSPRSLDPLMKDNNTQDDTPKESVKSDGTAEPMPRRQPPSQDDWARIKPIFINLYFDKGKPLKDVDRILRQEHNFHATPTMYKRHMETWGLKKYITASEKEKIVAFVKDNHVKGDALQKLKLDGRPARLDLGREYMEESGAHGTIADALPTKGLEERLTRANKSSGQHEAGPAEPDYDSAEATDGSDREELDVPDGFFSGNNGGLGGSDEGLGPSSSKFSALHAALQRRTTKFEQDLTRTSEDPGQDAVEEGASLLASPISAHRPNNSPVMIGSYHSEFRNWPNRLTSYWSFPEQQKFTQLIAYYGRDFSALADFMGTKSSTMIKNHYNRQIAEGKSDLEELAQAAELKRANNEPMGPPPSPCIWPDRNAPDSPPSAYMIFSNKIREANQDWPIGNIHKVVHDRWQELTPKDKELFELEANTAKEQYNTQLLAYKKTDSYKEYTRYVADVKAKQSRN